MRTCKIENCHKKHYSLGFCNTHYQRFARYGHTDLPPSRSEQLFNEGKAFCSCCQKTKPLEEFGEDKHTKTGKRRYCKICESEKSQTQYLKHLRRIKSTRLKYRFGISIEKYDEILDKQRGVCKICQRPPDAGNLLSVDHNHTTGKIRSLLCQNCNAGLGMFQENTDLLTKAIDYLKEHHA